MIKTKDINFAAYLLAQGFEHLHVDHENIDEPVFFLDGRSKDDEKYLTDYFNGGFAWVNLNLFIKCIKFYNSILFGIDYDQI